MEKTNAFPYIPQRPPFVLVDNLIDCDPVSVHTEFTIPATHVLVNDGHLSEAGLMENIAQTCATRIGWINKDKPVRIGVIGSISNFEVVTFPRVGETIDTIVTIVSEVFDAVIVHAETRLHDDLIAQCDMKVFVI